MAKIASPLHTKRIPKSVSKPATTAEAAATVAESVVAPTARRAAKPAAKAVKPVAKVAKPAVKAIVPAAEPALAKPAKVHKHKLVRDSFTMPKDEYQALEALKGRALGLEKHVRKSELLRAGIQALSAMNDRVFLKAIGAVPTLKTGRPKSD